MATEGPQRSRFSLAACARGPPGCLADSRQRSASGRRTATSTRNWCGNPAQTAATSTTASWWRPAASRSASSGDGHS
eukprot:11193346-Lingulodinium_polyedra.AAC.1